MQGLLGRQLHLLLRCYASAHLAAVYAVYVGGLPGFGAVLQPEAAEPALRVAGLWQPRVALAMLPTLGLLLLVRGLMHMDSSGWHFWFGLNVG